MESGFVVKVWNQFSLLLGCYLALGKQVPDSRTHPMVQELGAGSSFSWSISAEWQRRGIYAVTSWLCI